MEAAGFEPDPWQALLLRSTADRILLLCARQCGKSTATAGLAFHTALFQPDSLVLLLSPSQRQSGELFRKVLSFHDGLGRPIGTEQVTATTLCLKNGSRIVSLPGSPETIRGYSAVRLLILDEAASVSDETFLAVNPMLSVSRGRMVCLSTPFGRRGFFHAAWEDHTTPWERFLVMAEECPRVNPEWLAEQKGLIGERWYRQEYLCSFEDTIDQVFSTASVLAAFETNEQPLFVGR
jgi:hypothetical protein